MLLPAQFYIISSVLVLFGTKNPSASTAEVPRYQQVSVISLTRPASAGSFPGWGNSPHSREGHGVTVQLCIPSTDCSGQPKDELQQFTITIHTERHSSPALALAVLPLYTHLLKPSCHHPTAPGRLDCLTPEWQCFPPGGAWGPLSSKSSLCPSLLVRKDAHRNTGADRGQWAWQPSHWVPRGASDRPAM